MKFAQQMLLLTIELLSGQAGVALQMNPKSEDIL